MSVGEQIATASTSLAASISSTVPTLAPVAAASAFAAVGVRVGDERHRTIAAPGDIAAVNLADPPRSDDPESHKILPRALVASKKEYLFHLDL